MSENPFCYKVRSWMQSSDISEKSAISSMLVFFISGARPFKVGFMLFRTFISAMDFGLGTMLVTYFP